MNTMLVDNTHYLDYRSSFRPQIYNIVPRAHVAGARKKNAYKCISTMRFCVTNGGKTEGFIVLKLIFLPLFPGILQSQRYSFSLR